MFSLIPDLTQVDPHESIVIHLAFPESHPSWGDYLLQQPIPVLQYDLVIGHIDHLKGSRQVCILQEDVDIHRRIEFGSYIAPQDGFIETQPVVPSCSNRRYTPFLNTRGHLVWINSDPFHFPFI